MTITQDWAGLAGRLDAALAPTAPAVAITFTDTPPAGVSPFDAPIAPPSEDGRTGRVPAGCVFWMRGADRTFSTVAEDHANCSVGSWTHGFIGLEEAATRGDVGTLLESGWVTMEMVPGIPVVSETPGSVRAPAPLLGQHTADVLREHLGLDDAEIERLRRIGVLGALGGTA